LLKSFKNNPDLFFQFRLARDLGITVSELNSNMSSYEYQSWVQFYLYEQSEKNIQLAIADAEAKKRGASIKGIKR
tara:strand:+ start:573 stop:797 length:225 start_codon:yes stop_codon:yes gene_type:complete